jgi:sec-independent protein translocase protein TatA
MGSLSIWHILIVIAVLLLLFGGRGRVSNLMGDLAKGMKAFKSGMKDESEGPQPDPAPKVIASDATRAAQPEHDPAKH